MNGNEVWRRRRTDGRTDRHGKTICLPLSGWGGGWGKDKLQIKNWVSRFEINVQQNTIATIYLNIFPRLSFSHFNVKYKYFVKCLTF